MDSAPRTIRGVKATTTCTGKPWRDEGFKWWSLGRASAVAFLLFILMFIVTMVQLRLGRERSAA
jgi:ABC-type sugar transport system permease subunit